MPGVATLFGLLSIATIGYVYGQGADTFYFSVNPEATTSVVSGQATQLRCRVSAERGVTYYWQLNGRRLANTTRRHQRGPDLHITRADRERDAGEFTCVALNTTSGFSLASQAATLTVQWLSDEAGVQLQTPEGGSTSVNSGDDVTLRCTADGSGELRFEWYRNADKVTKTERVVPRARRLHLKNVSTADNGVYRCAAHNEAGSIHSTNNYALAVPADGAALVRVVPKMQTARRGADARFDCTFEGAEAVEWFFADSGVALVTSQRHTVHGNGSLTVHRVRPADEGMYRCVGLAADKKHPQAYAAELQLAYLSDLGESSFEPPQPTIESGGVVVVAERREFELTCVPPSGRPPPRVWWRGPQGRVVSDSGSTRVDDTRLIIESAKQEDAGNYSCVAENMAGSSTATIKLVVSTPPVITQDPISVTVDEGAPTSLSCGVRALASVTTIRWRRENGGGGGSKYVTEQPGDHPRPNNGTLYFKAVSVLDRGAYQCEVNTTGFKPVLSKKAHIYVKEMLKFLPRPVNKKFELGSFAKLYCKAQGATPPVIKWIKEGSRMLFEFPEHVQDINGTLHFSKVTHSDKGKYTCVATNSQGIINATIEVDVIVAPKFSVAPSNPTEAIEGNAVMFHCVAEGDPKPTIQWDKNSVPNGFDQKRFIVLENGTLLVSEVYMSDEGKYACTAGNSGGFRREEVQLIVRSRENYRPDGGLIEELGQDGAMMTKTVTITLSAAAAYMLLVVGLMVWCRYRRLRRKQAYLQSGAAEGTNSLLTKAENGDAGGGERTEMKDGQPGKEHRGEAPDGGSHSHSSAGSGPHGKKSRSSYDKLQFPRQDLTTILPLGHGQFGEVFVAKAKGMRGATSEDEGVVVMVKSLQTRDESALQEFKRVMDMHHKLRHENIARLLGLCRETDPHLMITEYTDWGDLKQLLLATTAAAAARKDGVSGGRAKSSQPSPPPPLTVAQIVQLAQQVARGMEHLANQRMIHKDLAARNCLVTSQLHIKISIPALCKDTYAHEYFKQHDQMIPLRWMPYEAVFEDEYSTKSDVWSFAVLVWEMMHAGELPFAKLSDETVLGLLRARELQWRTPKATPEPLQPLLQACWADSPRDRPSFCDLVQRFEEVCVDSQI